jgi:hypothetical protein
MGTSPFPRKEGRERVLLEWGFDVQFGPTVSSGLICSFTHTGVAILINPV